MEKKKNCSPAVEKSKETTSRKMHWNAGFQRMAMKNHNEVKTMFSYNGSRTKASQEFSTYEKHSQRLMTTTTKILVTLFLLCISLSNIIGLNCQEVWERPAGMPQISHLEVMCGSDHMEVHLSFDSPFHGLVASKGMYAHQGCVYVPPRTGKKQFVFNIYYEQCGTKPDNHGKFYENTVVVQYDEELIEAWDEAKRLRCEWFNDYEKTASETKPMYISDLEVVELNFHGDNVDCWMEIQEGKGPWAPPLSGIVPLGTTITMVIAIKDPSGEFDMRVKGCHASDGQTGRSLQLSDPEGCILRPKLIGKFSKVKLDDPRATVLTYAYMSAFKFPDMLNVHMQCTVEICRHGCPDHCSRGSRPTRNHDIHAAYTQERPLAAAASNNVDVRPQSKPPPPLSTNLKPPQPVPNNHLPPHIPVEGTPVPVPHPSMLPPAPGFKQYALSPGIPDPRVANRFHKNQMIDSSSPPSPIFLDEKIRHHQQILENMQLKAEPKADIESDIKIESRIGDASDKFIDEEVAHPHKEAPEEVNADVETTSKHTAMPHAEKLSDPSSGEIPLPMNIKSRGIPKGPRTLRLRRSVSDNKDSIGVNSVFRVVSEADLNFVMNKNTSIFSDSSPSPILKGKIQRNPTDPIYGICLPRIGFSLVFFGLGILTLLSMLVAAFLTLTHYRLKRINKIREVAASTSPSAMNYLNGPPPVAQPLHNILPIPLFWLRK